MSPQSRSHLVFLEGTGIDFTESSDITEMYQHIERSPLPSSHYTADGLTAALL